MSKTEKQLARKFGYSLKTPMNIPIIRDIFWFVAWCLHLPFDIKIGDFSGKNVKINRLKKVLIIGASHSTNWDTFFAFVYAAKLKRAVRILIKDEAFAGIWGPIIKFFGGVPLDRSKDVGLVGQAVEIFKSDIENFFLCFIPAGKRAKKDAEIIWHLGFLHIAMRVPNLPIAIGLLFFPGSFGERRLYSIISRLWNKSRSSAEVNMVKLFYPDTIEFGDSDEVILDKLKNNARAIVDIYNEIFENRGAQVRLEFFITLDSEGREKPGIKTVLLD